MDLVVFTEEPSLNVPWTDMILMRVFSFSFAVVYLFLSLYFHFYLRLGVLFFLFLFPHPPVKQRFISIETPSERQPASDRTWNKGVA